MKDPQFSEDYFNEAVKPALLNLHHAFLKLFAAVKGQDQAAMIAAKDEVDVVLDNIPLPRVQLYSLLMTEIKMRTGIKHPAEITDDALIQRAHEFLMDTSIHHEFEPAGQQMIYGVKHIAEQLKNAN